MRGGERAKHPTYPPKNELYGYKPMSPKFLVMKESHMRNITDKTKDNYHAAIPLLTYKDTYIYMY